MKEINTYQIPNENLGLMARGMCVCVCVCERERERGGGTKGKKKREEGEREEGRRERRKGVRVVCMLSNTLSFLICKTMVVGFTV